MLAELRRELIVANTNDGLASARARGQVGGRRPKLTARASPPPRWRAGRCSGMLSVLAELRRELIVANT
ncbi:hypothetical protein ACFYYV_31390, partial [Streptomyces sp. NPDC001978]